MFRQKNVATVAGDALDSVSPYVDQLAHDEKLRERLAAAITAGAAARKRAKRHVGLLGLATTLASDPVLRAQVSEAISQLQKARGRMEKTRSHKLRNAVLLVTAAGVVVAAVPSLRDAVMSKVRGDDGSDWAAAPPAGPPVEVANTPADSTPT